MGNGGMSSVLLDAAFPYSPKAFDAYIGYEFKEKHNSVAASESLAAAAFTKTITLTDPKEEGIPLGVGVTASLGYTNQREGRENSMYVSISDGKEIHTFKKEFNPSSEGRNLQEVLGADFIGTCLKHFIQKMESKETDSSVIAEYNKFIGKEELLSMMIYHDKPEFFVYCGSFNPPHEGHLEVIQVISKLISARSPDGILIGEMTTAHFEKDSVSDLEIVERANRASDYLGIPVIITSQAKLEDKVSEFPNWRESSGYINFVMGYDVFEKVAATQSTNEFLMHNFTAVKLIVFPRHGVSISNFQMKTVPYLSHLCMTDEVQNVKIDMSSTQIRNANNTQKQNNT